MTKTTRNLLFVLLGLAAIIAMGFALSQWHAAHEFPGSIMIDGHDVSDSPFSWMIVIPVLFLVGIIVTVVCAGAALIAVLAVGFAIFMVLLAALLIATPFLLILGVPVLVIYGFIKLVERDRKAALA
ncbi:MAG: hypothetical protein JNK75_06150 [Betaproteobacteria bacterium]|nr:hypothetical protein [Betaproteobacteria bacterium]